MVMSAFKTRMSDPRKRREMEISNNKEILFILFRFRRIELKPLQ